jgi:hypothetical protein
LRVDLSEVGERPQIATAARLNAPQGAKVIADALADKDFAQHAVLVLDWEKGVLAIAMAKRYPDIGRRADIDFVVDMEDAFTRDQFGLETVMEIIDHLESEFRKKDEEAKLMVGRA